MQHLRLPERPESASIFLRHQGQVEKINGAVVVEIPVELGFAPSIVTLGKFGKIVKIRPVQGGGSVRHIVK
jgi:hypothetical protein